MIWWTENLFTFKGDWRERENVHQQADHDGLRSKYFHRPDSHIQPFADIQSHQVDMPLPTFFTFLHKLILCQWTQCWNLFHTTIMVIVDPFDKMIVQNDSVGMRATYGNLFNQGCLAKPYAIFLSVPYAICLSVPYQGCIYVPYAICHVYYKPGTSLLIFSTNWILHLTLDI